MVNTTNNFFSHLRLHVTNNANQSQSWWDMYNQHRHIMRNSNIVGWH